MLWAVCCTGFLGFLRAGEFTVDLIEYFDPRSHLAFTDVSVDSREAPRVISVRIKQSKTGPFRQGAVIHLGRTDKALCPVSAILAYLALRGSRQGPLFMFNDGSSLSSRRLVAELRQGLSACGFDCNLYAWHSFRIEAATTAAKHGVEDSTIRALGRWRNDAYQLYIKFDSTTLAKMSQNLAD